VLSLAAFQTFTVSGAAAQLISGYRLGRQGSQSLAVVLAAPYLVLALAGHPGFRGRRPDGAACLVGPCGGPGRDRTAGTQRG
jgi:hypothetical protein